MQWRESHHVSRQIYLYTSKNVIAALVNLTEKVLHPPLPAIPLLVAIALLGILKLPSIKVEMVAVAVR